MFDALFDSIERQQGDRPFGRLLDAGTGLHSLRWIATLAGRKDKGLTLCTAVTADRTMQRNCLRQVQALLGDDDDDSATTTTATDYINVIVGNWFDDDDDDDDDANNSKPLCLEEESFDVILADYLIGAMDGFSPYQQDQIIPKLARYLKPNGRLYIVGLQPLPDSVPNEPIASLVCRVRQVRDACILLAGHRCYREFPVDWIQRQVVQQQQQRDDQQQQYQLHLVHSSRIPILYSYETICRQINVGRSKFPYFPTNELAESMAAVLDDLEAQIKRAMDEAGRIKLGFDYVVTAEKKRYDEN